ncbi:MAG: M20 family metallopeptidase [Clostridium sp.]|uniref:M20 family metallopeptidase n=1 Tax=Clostridium sp. TaxID=1506 RepID=UPI003042B0B9
MDNVKQKISDYIDRKRAYITSMADDIFEHPEIGFNEFYACELLTNELRRNKFSVETGIAGLETAFRGIYQSGTGGPSIGLLCEYDALAEIGHGCGHHMQGPAILGAAFAIKELLGGENYKLVVYGTPAEETEGGKINMQEQGCFNDIDVALMMHAAPTTTTDVKCMAMSSFNVTFGGKSAHAALMPDEGRSALDAILLSCNGIEFLREHVKEDTRLHYTILNAGGASNVVPAKAEAEFCMRSYNSAYLEKVIERVENVIKGAALMTGTTYSIKKLPTYKSKVPVFALNKILMDNANIVNAPTIRPTREKTGSTDFGNVMYNIPGACIRVAFVPEGTSSHSKEYIKAGKTKAAHDCAIYAAKILAYTCHDLIIDSILMKEVTSEFESTKAKMENE